MGLRESKFACCPWPVVRRPPSPLSLEMLFWSLLLIQPSKLEDRTSKFESRNSTIGAPVATPYPGNPVRAQPPTSADLAFADITCGCRLHLCLCPLPLRSAQGRLFAFCLSSVSPQQTAGQSPPLPASRLSS